MLCLAHCYRPVTFSQYAEDAKLLSDFACSSVSADDPPRERILAAARELFYRHGIHAVGVDVIAAAAMTNKMTLYRHFGSKDALIAAYVQMLADEGDDFWNAISKAHENDAEAQLEAWLDSVDERLRMRGARGCAIANAAVELPADHPARGIIESYKLRKRDHMMRVLHDAGYKDPQGLADEIFLLFEGAQISLQCAGRAGPGSRLIAMVRAVLNEAPRRSTKPGRAAAAAGH